MWNRVTVRNPSNYININLYFPGHLDRDILLESVGKVVSLKPEWTQELSNIFKQLDHKTHLKLRVILRWLSLTKSKGRLSNGRRGN